jgi:hypothetical protein
MQNRRTMAAIDGPDNSRLTFEQAGEVAFAATKFKKAGKNSTGESLHPSVLSCVPAYKPTKFPCPPVDQDRVVAYEQHANSAPKGIKLADIQDAFNGSMKEEIKANAIVTGGRALRDAGISHDRLDVCTLQLMRIVVEASADPLNEDRWSLILQLILDLIQSPEWKEGGTYLLSGGMSYEWKAYSVSCKMLHGKGQ